MELTGRARATTLAPGARTVRFTPVHGCWRGLAWALVCGLCAARASAQGQATPSDSASGGSVRRLTLSATLRETLSDDLFFAGTGGGPDPSTSATLGLAFGLSHHGLNLGGAGWANGTLVGPSRRRNVQSGLGWGVDLGFSPRTRMRFDTSYSDGLNLDAVYGSSEAFPQLDVKSFVGDLGLSRRVSPSTSMGATLTGTFIRYRSSALFDTAALPSETLVQPDIVQPSAPEGTESPLPENPAGLPIGPDNTLAVLGILTGAGLRTPSVDYWTWRAGGDVAHQFSSVSRGRVAFGYRGALGSPAALTAGDEIDAEVEWSRTLGGTAGVSLAYADRESRYATRFGTHTASVRVDKTVSRRLSANASVGGSFLEAPQRGDASWEAIGGAGLSWRRGRTALSVRYDRNRSQSILGGRSYTSDSGVASFAQRLTRRLSVSAFGSYRSASDALGQGSSYRSLFIGSNLGLRLAKRLNVGAVYSYQHFDRQEFAAADRYVASVFAGYSLSRR